LRDHVEEAVALRGVAHAALRPIAKAAFAVALNVAHAPGDGGVVAKRRGVGHAAAFVRGARQVEKGLVTLLWIEDSIAVQGGNNARVRPACQATVEKSTDPTNTADDFGVVAVR
jgi:hypothetical protein